MYQEEPASTLQKLAFAPHANRVHFRGHDGYWTTTGSSHKIFLDHKTHKILFPTELRGRLPKSLTPDDFHNLDNSDYKEFLEEHKHRQNTKELHDNFNLTPKGIQLLERLKKTFIKHKIDIDLSLFDAIKSATDPKIIPKIIQKLGKQYTKFLGSHPEDLDIRAEKDISHAWSKLEALFKYNLDDFKPQLPDLEVIHHKLLKSITDDFIQHALPHVDEQMSEVHTILTGLHTAINQNNQDTAKKLWHHLETSLAHNITQYHQHSIGSKSEKIMRLEEYRKLHDALFHH